MIDSIHYFLLKLQDLVPHLQAHLAQLLLHKCTQIVREHIYELLKKAAWGYVK
jgi:hypothetical protein